jgi:hypothetical protein
MLQRGRNGNEGRSQTRHLTEPLPHQFRLAMLDTIIRPPYHYSSLNPPPAGNR